MSLTCHSSHQHLQGPFKSYMDCNIILSQGWTRAMPMYALATYHCSRTYRLISRKSVKYGMLTMPQALAKWANLGIGLIISIPLAQIIAITQVQAKPGYWLKRTTTWKQMRDRRVHAHIQSLLTNKVNKWSEELSLLANTVFLLKFWHLFFGTLRAKVQYSLQFSARIFKFFGRLYFQLENFGTRQTHEVDTWPMVEPSSKPLRITIFSRGCRFPRQYSNKNVGIPLS